MLKKITNPSCWIALLVSLIFCTASAAFEVKHIEVQGIQRISKGTVLNYLPIRVGDEVDRENSSSIIQSLYKTGFFSDVQVAQRGTTLVIKVVEQATIGSIEIRGNKLIPTDKLKEALKDLGFIEGHVYNRALLENIKQSLQREYFSQGLYNAVVDIKATKQQRNRVAIILDINEGKAALIKEIRIIGHQVYSNRALLKQFSLSSTRPWSFLTHSNRYSREKLDADLEQLRSFYLDRGYLKFNIVSSEVSLSTNREQVYIVIHIDEGAQYYLSSYELTGNLVVSKQTLRSLIELHKGMIFSRQKILGVTKTLAEYYGSLGYAFTNIESRPKVNDKNKSVAITFYVNPGQRVYVRHINFSGNNKTADVVLRRAMRQMEGSLINLKNVKESEHQLNLLGYLKGVKQETVAVPGTNNQVDLNFNVTESPSASANIGAGYGSDGLFVNAGINQQNFMGTGKSFSLNFNNDKLMRVYSLSYNNPYYTEEGIQRGFDVFSRRTTPGDVNISNYITDSLGGSIYYTLPLQGDRDSINLGFGYRNTRLRIGSTPSDEMIQFICDDTICSRNKRTYDQLLLNASWGRTSYDRAIFTTKGLKQSIAMTLSLPLPELKHDLEYYILSYHIKGYHPIVKNFIFTAQGLLEFGDGYHNQHHLPIIENFYSGGIGSVRGYESNILGPKDSKGEPIGGNFNVFASMAVIFPNPISENLRTSLFVDGGNVFDTHSKMSLGQLRGSVGIAAEWRMAFGVLEFSLARAFHHRHGDKLDPFGFNIGTGL